VESYRAFKFPFPSDIEGIKVMDFELATGNTYTFADETGDTGVTLKVIDRTGDGYNEVEVKRLPFAPLNPEFPPFKAPRILPVRFDISQFGILSMMADLRIDVHGLDSYGIDPNVLTIYYRPFADSGLFIPLETLYNPAKDQIQTVMFGFGEFVVGYPDVADASLPPLLNQPESLEVKDFMTPHPSLAEVNEVYAVNQDQAIVLSWNPQGLASSYQLEIALDSDFTQFVKQEGYLVQANYNFTDAQLNTPYFWRVASENTTGTSAWATGAFTTEPPQLTVVYPNGGESIKKGATIFIQWQDNLTEDVTMALLKGDVVVETIATVPSHGALEWELSLTLAPGDDYAMQIQSTMDADIMDISDNPFTVQ
jgi:hypothetical protein